MRVLSFDCSSTTVAYALLEVNDKKITLKSLAYIKPIKSKDFILRLIDTRDKLKKIIEKEKPDLISIEDIVKYFPGKSSANTIITLATFNRMLCLLAYDYLKKTPNLYSVMAIRHNLKINGHFPSKEEMPEVVATWLKIPFPYKYSKKQKKMIENEDMADAVAVGLYTINLLINPKIKKAKKK